MPRGIFIRTKNPTDNLGNFVKKGGLNPNTGKKRPPFSEEWKRKIGEANKGKKCTEETRKKMSKASKGKKKPSFSEEHKRNLSEAKKGKKPSEETRKKLSKALIGNKRTLGYKHTEKAKRQMSEARKGDKCHFWQGGISFEPYTTDWTKTLKRAIRERDNYVCQLCSQYGNYVHHIDYIKANCSPTNLIILCDSCNAKVNFNRTYWTNYFKGRQKITN